MKDLPPNEAHEALAQDSSNLDGEPAAKRIKIQASDDKPVADQFVPGEGLHDAPAPAGKENEPADAEEKPKHDNRKAGLAPVKKEHVPPSTFPNPQLT